jgi:two-component system, OmpR family, response regulator
MDVVQPTPDRQVIVADADEVFRSALAGYFGEYGFMVTVVADAAEMQAALSQGSVDLLVLDVGFPGEAVFAVCRRLAQEAGPAIILLSSDDDEADRVLCLELGADDYLRKPCSPREMLARAKAVLRRYDGRSLEAAPADGAFELNGRHLSAPNGATLLLTRGEVRMLGIFLENPGRILSRDDILEKARFGTGVSDRSIDVQISRFRRKLNDYSAQDLIQTYRGAGYVLVGKVRLA